MSPALVWIVVIVLLLVYEGYAIANKRPGDTLSEAVWRVSFNRPIIPFLAGMVAGHFFFGADCISELFRK